MKPSSGNNMAPLMPPWATTAPPYVYDATPTHCYLCTCNALCDYDDTRCANSRTSSTTVTTTFNGDPGFADSGGLFEDASGGHEQDTADHGMSLYGYRYYKPELGRWVNRDPIGEEAFFHLYTSSMTRSKINALSDIALGPAYCMLSNDLINSADKHGLATWQITAASMNVSLGVGASLISGTALKLTPPQLSCVIGMQCWSSGIQAGASASLSVAIVRNSSAFNCEQLIGNRARWTQVGIWFIKGGGVSFSANRLGISGGTGVGFQCARFWCRVVTSIDLSP